MNTYLRFSVVMSSLNLLPVCPWFVPAAPASLRLGVEALRSEIELYAPRQIVQREEEPYSEIRVVHSGLLSQAVINLKTVESTLSQIRRRRARGTSGLWPSSP